MTTLIINRTMKADADARPLFVGADGKPPSVSIGDNILVDGLIFGGERPATDVGSNTIVMGKNSVVQNCTLFNYINGIQNGSDAHGNIFRRNRFVRCGYGSLSHPLYVSNLNSSKEADGVLAEENIMIGCYGYSVHFYHQPSYGVARYNFIGDASYGLALQGDQQGPVSGNHNIIWSCSNTPLYNVTALGTCDNNVWKGCTKPTTPDNANYFVSPVETSGTNPVVWQESDVTSSLGNSSANIDTAIAEIEACFDGKTVQQIHDDATIDSKFLIIEAVIDIWKMK